MQINDDVGYGKPPKVNQFKKGVSGNPRGRPKGSRNRATMQKTLQERIVINDELGQRKSVSKDQALCQELVNKAISGDVRAAHEVRAARAEERSREAARPYPIVALGDADQKVAQHIVDRIKALVQGGEDEIEVEIE